MFASGQFWFVLSGLLTIWCFISGVIISSTVLKHRYPFVVGFLLILLFWGVALSASFIGYA